MQGIYVINGSNGQPAVLTIDLRNLDPDLRPFVDSILNALEQRVKDTNRADQQAVAHATLNRGYGDDEPNYSDIPAT